MALISGYLAEGSAFALGVLTELSGNGYARQATTVQYDTVTSVVTVPGAAFPTATGTWTAGTYAALYDALTSGNLLFAWPNATAAIVSGATASVPSVNVTLTTPLANSASAILPRTTIGTIPVIGASGISTTVPVQSGIATLSYTASTGVLAAANFVKTLTDAASVTLDASTASYFTWTVAAVGRTLVLTNGTNGQIVELEVVQDGTGSRTITTTTNVTWAAGTLPTLSTPAASVDLLRFTYNSAATKWRGELVGKAFA